MDWLSKLQGWPEEPNNEERMRANMPAMLEGLDGTWADSRNSVRAVLGLDYDVDEMAIHFETQSSLYDWITVLVGRDFGWELFNQADDEVRTSPLPSRYSVRYWFLRHPKVPYRLEMMLLGTGYSPYHGLLRDTSVAHASFKCADESAFGNAVHTLRESGTWEPWQHCVSSYGRFSYFGPVLFDSDQWIVPIKPRVNLRDGGSSGN